MLTLDEEDYETLGYGDMHEALLWSGWAEQRLAWSRAQAKAYAATPWGKAKKRESNRKWAALPSRKAWRVEYNASLHGKVLHKRYRQSAKGKASRRRLRARQHSARQARINATRAKLNQTKRIEATEAQAIVAAYQAGRSLAQLTAQFGRHRRSIKLVLTKAGLR